MSKRIITLSVVLILGLCALFVGECSTENKILTVYSGKGLKKAMEEIKTAYEQSHDIQLNIIYAGSVTCLDTIMETRNGDIYIPGGLNIINNAGDLVDSHQFVALHVPILGVHKDNPSIESFEDLAKPGIRLTIGNPKMCSMGRVSDEILNKSALKEDIVKNIVIRSASVNELLKLVLTKEVDAAIIWKDMMLWPESLDLKGIEIPPDINEINEIHVAVLTVSENKKAARLFADYVASEGKIIFEKQGFDQK